MTYITVLSANKTKQKKNNRHVIKRYYFKHVEVKVTRHMSEKHASIHGHWMGIGLNRIIGRLSTSGWCLFSNQPTICRRTLLETRLITIVLTIDQIAFLLFTSVFNTYTMNKQ